MRQLFPNNNFVAPKLGTKDRLVIAEAPGEDESIVGEPLVGGAGRWFDGFCRAAGINRHELTLVNCIQCRPPDNDFPTDAKSRRYITRDAAYQSVAHCARAHVIPLLHSRNWRRVDLLGDKALKFYGGKNEGINKWQGSPIAVPELGTALVAIPTFHPAYIARNQYLIPKVVNDLKKSLVVPPEYYNLTPSLEDVQNFRFTEFTFDIECPKYWQMGDAAPVEMVGLCAQNYRAMVVPFRGAYISELKRIFREAKQVSGHNIIQYDLPRLRRDDVRISESCDVQDTMLLQHLCFPDFPHDLEFVGSQFSNKPAWKDDKANFELYCARDTDVTRQALGQLRPMAAGFGLAKVYETVSRPLALICKLMHETGFKVDPGRIEIVRDKFLQESRALEQLLPAGMRTTQVPKRRREPAPPGTLSPKTGKPVKFIHVDDFKTVVPWRSTEKKKEFLYETLGLEVQTNEEGNVTTGKVALDKLYNRTKNPAIKAIRRLNQIDEVLTTFAKPEMLRIARMHPHFNVHGTSSGRLSSSDPNLQNIPASARYIYVPSYPDWRLVDVDYSQIENRLTAYFAGDTKRLARFAADPNFSEHKYACSIFLGIPYDQVVKESGADSPYTKAKKIVHGTNYGEGPRKIAKDNDLDYKEVKRLQDKWKDEIRATITWQENCAEQAKRDGYLTTPFGRRRWFYTSSYYTESLSFLPQSTAADIIFRAMIGMMYQRIGWPTEKVSQVVGVTEAIPAEARLLIQVHDSLVFECPEAVVEPLCATLKRVMEQPWPELGGFSCPISIKVGEPGASWGEVE